MLNVSFFSSTAGSSLSVGGHSGGLGGSGSSFHSSLGVMQHHLHHTMDHQSCKKTDSRGATGVLSQQLWILSKIPIHWWEIRRMWCASGEQKTLNLPVHAWWLRLIIDSGISFRYLPWTHCIDLIVKLPTAKDFPVKVIARFFYSFQFHLHLPCFHTAPAKTFSTAL